MSVPEQPPAVKSKRSRLVALAGLAVLAVIAVTTWLVLPSRSQDGAGAVTGDAVRQILLDGTELTAMLDQPFTTVTGPPSYGGFEAMDDSAAPAECAVVIDVAQKREYASASVQGYARETWIDSGPGSDGYQPPNTRVMFVKEAVVALPSAAAAREQFDKFAQEWKNCDGRPVDAVDPGAEITPRLPGTEMHITDVRVTDDLLAASIVLDRSPKAPDARAIGVQGNCIVGVLIAFTGVENASGSGDPQTSSMDVVRAMMAKVAERS